MTTLAASESVLSEDMLERFRSRASTYDRENRFFTEDFEELRQAGYLRLPIPRELGGFGLNLAAVCREQRRLAYYAPATAVAVNMHLYWMGVAATLYSLGDTSCQWMLEEGAQGEVFAAGHAEAGNDLPAMLSTTRAERADGGYRLSGHKLFGTLTPVWTRYGLHAQDNADPAAPKIVHAFLPRDTPGYTIKETWDTLGMRATRSDDTLLDGAFVPDRYIARVLPAGFAGRIRSCCQSLAGGNRPSPRSISASPHALGTSRWRAPRSGPRLRWVGRPWRTTPCCNTPLRR